MLGGLAEWAGKISKSIECLKCHLAVNIVIVND